MLTRRCEVEVLRKKIKYSIFIIVFLLISIVLFIALRPEKPIIIGFVGGLTGNSSEIGVDGRNAVELAVAEVNQAGGIRGQKIQLLIEDDKNDAAAALAADQRIVEEGAKVIIGHMSSGMMELTIPFIKEKDVLMISPTISLDSLSGIDDNFLRLIPLNKYQGQFLADAAYHRKKIKKVAIIYDNRNKGFAEGIILSFTKQILDYGGQTVITEAFTTGNKINYSQITKKIGQTEAEGILIIASSADAAMFCQHLFKENINLPVFMPMWPMTKDLIKQGGPAVEGVYLVSHMDIHSATKEYSQFKKNYYDQYGGEPSFASLLSYEAAKMLFDSMSETNEFTTEKIKENILRKKVFQGLQNEITLDQYGDTMRQIYLYQVQNGDFIKVEK